MFELYIVTKHDENNIMTLVNLNKLNYDFLNKHKFDEMKLIHYQFNDIECIISNEKEKQVLQYEYINSKMIKYKNYDILIIEKIEKITRFVGLLEYHNIKNTNNKIYNIDEFTITINDKIMIKCNDYTNINKLLDKLLQ